MAAEEKKPAPEAKKEEAAPAKKKPPIKVIGAVAAIMLVEAAGVYFVVGMSKPKVAAATEVDVHGAEHAAAQQLVEIDLIEDKFQNMQTGHVWMWDMRVVLKTSKKNEEFVNEEMGKRTSEIQEGIAQIIRRAQHSHLKEPDLVTVSRQIAAFADKVFGHDAQGNSRVERIMIPKCRGVDVER